MYPFRLRYMKAFHQRPPAADDRFDRRDAPRPDDRNGDRTIARGGGPARVLRCERAQGAGIDEGDTLRGLSPSSSRAEVGPGVHARRRDRARRAALGSRRIAWTNGKVDARGENRLDLASVLDGASSHAMRPRS